MLGCRHPSEEERGPWEMLVARLISEGMSMLCKGIAKSGNVSEVPKIWRVPCDRRPLQSRLGQDKSAVIVWRG